MDKKYVISADGGNSKTDYFLFDTEGNFVDCLRTDTCSHERFPDAYAGAFRAMNEQIGQLLARNGLTVKDLAAGAFGLAGADLPSQKEELNRIVERIGLNRFTLDNDSFLGIKAGIDKGFGICSINGSGSVTGGISPTGRRLQIGGVGSELAGDEAGGFYLGRKVLRAVYDTLYRMGPATTMADPVMKLLGVASKEYYMETVIEGNINRTLPNTELMRILFAAADAGDAAALDIVGNTAMQLARSTAGCISNLDFGDEVDIVLAGSVWVKAESPLMLQLYRRHLASLIDRRCNSAILEVPPATGAVFWALELAGGRPVGGEIRRKVIERVKALL
ncbi:N-acetylglucosamine kinase [Cohnella pontilimi]|uniref:N-acetylglucosamine kinase n=1 Tax=Cohnella pontilimi TaxID=2564100 RepID=A0A4U0FBT5_9BACL|nr:BadF/BadG/BcrA/BcrD ATPase family protein [Cohnella pontilimi]TJY42306.1 N-acetylglucosamine kinase [Cohnella pontilimi]